MYSKIEVKGQKAKTSDLRKGNQTSVDCPIYNFKCLRGDLTDIEIRSLLEDVVGRKLSFAQLKSEASRIKDVKEVQRIFISKTGSKNWEEVIERCVEARYVIMFFLPCAYGFMRICILLRSI